MPFRFAPAAGTAAFILLSGSVLTLPSLAAAPHSSSKGAAVPLAPAVKPYAVVTVDASAPVPALAFTAAKARVATASEEDGNASPATAGGDFPAPQATPTPPPDAADLLADAVRAVWNIGATTPNVALGCAVAVPRALAAAEGEPIAPGVTATALRAPGMVLVALRREPPPLAGEATAAPDAASNTDRVRFDVRLPRGLWRADAALVTGAEGEAPHLWRLEGALCPDTRSIAKTLPLAPGQTLVLRFSETVTAAREVAASCREFKGEGGSTYSGASVRTTLREVESITASLPAFVAKGDRDALCKKVHRALLSAAQAQAMLENGRGSGLFEQEQHMNALVAALSEVSCAAAGLVPSQSVVKKNEDGTPAAVRVTLTNAGPRTVPIVAVALGAPGSADADDSTAFPDAHTVFRGVAPGRSVSATFPVAAASGEVAEPRGMVQFIIGMGAAAVSARPRP